MNRFLLAIPLTCTLLCGCSRTPADFEAAMFLYRQNELGDALPLFEALAASDSANADVLAYLAETYRRFGRKGEAVQTARRALDIDPCNAFADEVIAEASNPLVGEWEGANPETTWVYLLKAMQCDPKDGNPLLTVWGESIRRRDQEMVSSAAEGMIVTGFFTKAILSYTEWVLTSLPPNAILLTNGDMDTYPVAALQEVELLRPDVVLANRGTLNEAWYARYLRDVKGVPLPFGDDELDALQPETDEDGNLATPADAIIAGWIDMWSEGKIRNPIAFAMTVSSEYPERFGKPLQYAGACRIVVSDEQETANYARIGEVLSRFTPDDFFGPWVSDQDRSPVRRVGTKNIVRNVIYAALQLAEHAQDAENAEAADSWLSFAERLDNGSDLGPVYAERIAALKVPISNR